MAFRRFLQRNRTEFLGGFGALVLIVSGIVIPLFLPNQLVEDLPIIPDATWFKVILTAFMVGSGVVMFFYLFIIHRYYVRKTKKDYVY